MEKLDLRKQWKQLYQPSAKKVEVVDVPPLLFAMIDGAIEPSSEPGLSPAFAAALQALYGISYTLQFTCKQRAEYPVDALFFFVDPLSPHPHDVDVKALMRVALVYDLPLALDVSTADILIEGLARRASGEKRHADA